MTNVSGRARSVALLLVLTLAPSVARAHAHLLRSEPASGARLAVAPATLRMWFSETPQLAVTRVTLLGSAGDTIALGAPQALPGRGLAIAVGRALGAGRYTVEYHTAAADGHPVRGSFSFVVAGGAAAAGATGAASASAPPAGSDSATVAAGASAAARGGAPPNQLIAVPPASERGEGTGRWTVTRWVELVALISVLGALGFRFGVVGRLGGEDAPLARDTLDGARRVALGALVLLVVAMLSRLAAESVSLQGAERAYSADALRALVLQTGWGRGWLLGLGGVIVAALGLLLAGRGMVGAWGVALIGGALLCLAPALTGHAVAGRLPALGVAVDALHVASAGTWMGGLLMLALVALPGAAAAALGTRAVRARTVVAAFSPVALAAAVTLVLTGLVSAWLRLGALGALWETEYGRVLLLKLGAVACVLGLGAYNWRVQTPALADDAALPRIRRSATAELLMAVVVLAITAILVATPLPEAPGGPTAPVTAVAP